MKKLTTICAALLCTLWAGAQNLVIGEKAPDLRVSEWLWDNPPAENKPKLIEFFHSGSPQCTSRVSDIESTAKRFESGLCVIVLAKEPPAGVMQALGRRGTYFAAIDDGSRTFDGFGVRYVPFSVLIDGRGKVLWFGNPSSLTADEIGRLLN
ncbi:MAG: hypothetical protein LUE26_11320 [Alistipes sp.]|nr:hypothetical protein [Alistipes sp.]